MKQIVLILVVLFSSCIISEEAPVKFVDNSLPTTPVVFTVPCSYSNTVTIDGIITSGNIINVAGENMPDYTITGETRTGPYGEFTMVLDNGRPTSNLLYTFKDGVCTPDNLWWTWESGFNFYDPENGKLYIEVLPNKDVKFTWCDLTFKSSSSSFLRLGWGSFILD